MVSTLTSSTVAADFGGELILEGVPLLSTSSSTSSASSCRHQRQTYRPGEPMFFYEHLCSHQSVRHRHRCCRGALLGEVLS